MERRLTVVRWVDWPSVGWPILRERVKATDPTGCDAFLTTLGFGRLKLRDLCFSRRPRRLTR